MSLLRPTVSAGGAPDLSGIDMLVKTASGTLSSERVATDSTDMLWDWSVAGQAKLSPNSSTARAVSKLVKSRSDGSLWGWAQETIIRAHTGTVIMGTSAMGATNISSSVTGSVSEAGVHDSDGSFRYYEHNAATAGLAWLVEYTHTPFRPKAGAKCSIVFRMGASISAQRLWIGLNQSGGIGDVTSLSGSNHAACLSLLTQDGDTKFKLHTRDGASNTVSAEFGPVVAAGNMYRIDYEFTTASSLTVTVTDLDTGVSGSVTATTTMPTNTLKHIVNSVTKENVKKRVEIGAFESIYPWGP